MPALSQYWFDKTDFRGATQFLSVTHPAGGWAWINWTNSGGRDSTLVWERPDNETVVPLVPQVNLASVLSTIDAVLSGGASRTSAVRAGWIPWKHVPYQGSNPGAHDPYSLLIRVWFRFHVGTPWYCSDADGDISYYLFPWLDSSGHLHISVDGWSYNYDGGGPFCTGAIDDALNAGVPAGMSKLQGLLNSLLSAFSRRTFSKIYLLPGNGDRSGGGTTNVDESAALALLP